MQEIQRQEVTYYITIIHNVYTCELQNINTHLFFLLFYQIYFQLLDVQMIKAQYLSQDLALGVLKEKVTVLYSSELLFVMNSQLFKKYFIFFVVYLCSMSWRSSFLVCHCHLISPKSPVVFKAQYCSNWACLWIILMNLDLTYTFDSNLVISF